MWESIVKFLESTGFYALTQSNIMLFGFIPGELLMLVISCVLLYLGIAKKFEPLLLIPIAFGMLLANIPWSGIVHMELFQDKNVDYLAVFQKGGLLDILYLGVKLGVYPPLIFLGVGAMTDFGPLIANPSSLLMGAAAQLGIFVAFIGARMIDVYLAPVFGWNLGFDLQAAASIGIIGGADGPTAIFLTSKLKPELLPAVAIAAYSYMALIPIIQPPIMRALTTKKERSVVMAQLREVSKTEKIVFPIVVTLLIGLLLPAALPLIGALMLGNLFRESGCTQRLSDTAQNNMINTLTIFLGLSVGATAGAERFLAPQTLMVIALGLFAFCFGTMGGLLLGKLMYIVSGGKVNPLIGSAGVSAVPMAARVSQVEGQKANPGNYLLMHAMGPNVAGVIGSAVAAGVLLVTLGK